MQVTSKEIYESVADKHLVPLEDIKFVGDSFFKEWAIKLKEPKTIILKLKKLGRMYLRKNKLEKQTERNHYYLNIHSLYTLSEEDKDVLLRELTLYRERLQEYILYVEKKKEIQALRYPHQPLLVPTDDPDRED